MAYHTESPVPVSGAGVLIQATTICHVSLCTCAETKLKDALGIAAVHALCLLEIYGLAKMVGGTFNEPMGERAEFAR